MELDVGLENLWKIGYSHGLKCKVLNVTVSPFLVFQTMFKSSQVFYSACFIKSCNREFLDKSTLFVPVYNISTEKR